MIFFDLPDVIPQEDFKLVCSFVAAEYYHIPPQILYAVSLVEGGKADSMIKNTNGTFDLGYMQFNTSYIRTLSKYGIKEEDVMTNDCYPFYLAAWRLSNHLNEDVEADIYTKASFYHSRTPLYNSIYRDKLLKYINKYDLKKIEKYSYLFKPELDNASSIEKAFSKEFVIIPEKKK